MRLAIFDTFSGAAGDMIISVLTGTSLSQKDLYRIVDDLNLSINVRVEDVIEKGIKANKLVVVDDAKAERTYQEVIRLINSSSLPEKVKKESSEIFRKIAQAEGKIHGREYQKAVFHEVGSDDAIFDVVASVTGILRLKDQGYSFYTTPIRLGSGSVDIHHGRYPVPAPATVEILKGSHLEVLMEGEGEIFTPTAAAILSHFCQGCFRQPFKVENVVYGAGSKELLRQPNVLRLITGKAVEHDSVVVLETLIDDTTGEIVAHAMEKIGEDVLDVSAIPATGKKGRPAVILRAIVEFSKSEEVGEKIITETGSLGVRIYPVYHRLAAYREIKEFDVEIDQKSFKIRVKESGNLLKPEFEDVKRISETLNIPLIIAYRKVLQQLGEH
ncbi:MAG: nickel pincer cofactor biosynthesis protein LarC [Archaeoglobaceae archaeon]